MDIRSLPQQNLKKLCVYAFDEILYKLGLENSPSFPCEFKDFSYPLFVTWTTGPKKKLRGCIGTFEAKNLQLNLPKYAKYAAFDDDRFNPISKDEVKTLNCDISLLVNFQKKSDIYDWTIGKDGIIVDFDLNGRHFNSTFLPEVAEEWGFTKDQTLQELIEKAGCDCKLKNIKGLIKITTYQSLKIGVSFEEYRDMKRSVKE